MAMSALVLLQLSILISCGLATFITNDTSLLAKSYEFIVIGGGTTALAVANRLAVKHTVLAIERGLDEGNVEVWDCALSRSK